jgi:hypothetical protein
MNSRCSWASSKAIDGRQRDAVSILESPKQKLELAKNAADFANADFGDYSAWASVPNLGDPTKLPRKFIREKMGLAVRFGVYLESKPLDGWTPTAGLLAYLLGEGLSLSNPRPVGPGAITKVLLDSSLSFVFYTETKGSTPLCAR